MLFFHPKRNSQAIRFPPFLNVQPHCKANMYEPHFNSIHFCVYVFLFSSLLFLSFSFYLSLFPSPSTKNVLRLLHYHHLLPTCHFESYVRLVGGVVCAVFCFIFCWIFLFVIRTKKKLLARVVCCNGIEQRINHNGVSLRWWFARGCHRSRFVREIFGSRPSVVDPCVPRCNYSSVTRLCIC